MNTRRTEGTNTMSKQTPANTASTTKRAAQYVTTVVAATVVLMLANAGFAAAATNPIDGITPDFTLFGVLDRPWKRMYAFIWAAVLSLLAIQVLLGGYKISRAKKKGYSGDLAESTDDFRDACVAFGVCSAIALILGAILFVVLG